MSLLSEPAALVDSRAGPSLSFSQCSFPHVRLLWSYKARRELVNKVNKWRSLVESQGQSFKLATKLVRSSDRSSYSVFIYLFIYLLSIIFSPIPLMWSKRKKGRLAPQRHIWRGPNNSPIAHTCSLAPSVVVCLTNAATPARLPTTCAPSSRCHGEGETGDNHHLLCITFSYISGQSRATERPQK